MMKIFGNLASLTDEGEEAKAKRIELILGFGGLPCVGNG